MHPALSVIIPHHGNVAALHICLLALERCTGFDNTEIIAVINAQAPAGPAFHAAHPNIRFLHDPRPGAAFARNTGAEAAAGEVLFFLDSDCTPEADALTKALDHAGIADIIGGSVTATTPKGRALSPAQAFETVFAFDQADYIARKGFSVTACLVTSRTMFDAVGPFRPGLSEDMDWCHRATKQGFTLAFAPEIRVSHPCRPSWGALRQKWQRLTAQSFAYGADSRAVWTAKACLMPASILAHAPRVLRSSALSAPRDKAAALAMLVRLRLWRMVEMLRLGLTPRL